MKSRTLLFLFLFLTVSFQLPAQWFALQPENPCTARHECGFTAHKGSLYLIGGRGNKPVEKFTIETMSWTPLASLPIELHHITPVSAAGKIYIVGGLTGQYPEEQPLSHVYMFDPKSNSLEKVLEIPVARRRGAAGVAEHKGKIYIVNGITNGHTSGTSAMFDVYDPKKNTWTVLPDAPSIRDHSGAAVVGDLLIAVGGRNTSYHEEDNFMAYMGKTNDQVDYYNLKTGTWGTFTSKLPAPAAGGGTVALDGLVYFIGGETEAEEANNQMYALDPEADTWYRKPFLKQGRHGTNAAVNNDMIYIAAGSANKGGGPELNSIEVWKEKWR